MSSGVASTRMRRKCMCHDHCDHCDHCDRSRIDRPVHGVRGATPWGGDGLANFRQKDATRSGGCGRENVRSTDMGGGVAHMGGGAAHMGGGAAHMGGGVVKNYPRGGGKERAVASAIEKLLGRREDSLCDEDNRNDRLWGDGRLCYDRRCDEDSREAPSIGTSKRAARALIAANEDSREAPSIGTSKRAARALIAANDVRERDGGPPKITDVQMWDSVYSAAYGDIVPSRQHSNGSAW
ncbi:hypothetical protein T484DRAFT_1756926 [Baffinella frigidus]|nr:hypothetical protein T484DRAFT_1756926 [Cryptophyta sp. CCMP2293]